MTVRITACIHPRLLAQAVADYLEVELIPAGADVSHNRFVYSLENGRGEGSRDWGLVPIGPLEVEIARVVRMEDLFIVAEALRWIWDRALPDTYPGSQRRLTLADCRCWSFDTSVCDRCGHRERPLSNRQEYRTECPACGGCRNCCECMSLGCGCRAMGHEPCSLCNRCPLCCRCTICPDCGQLSRRVCENCSECPDCCTCPRCEVCNNYICTCDNCYSFDQKKPIVFHDSKYSAARIMLPRYCGVEIETSTTYPSRRYKTYKRWAKKWNAGIVSDSSVSGLEIVTAPANGLKFSQQLNEVCRLLLHDDVRVADNCGLHVHVDARDFSHYDMRRLIFLYDNIEELVFQCVAKHRSSDDYCRRSAYKLSKLLNTMKKPVDSRKQLLTNLYRPPWGDQQQLRAQLKNCKGDKYNDMRYHAMNIHSWLHRGSVEFRHHEGTICRESIESWTQFMCAIVEYAFSHTERECREFGLSGSAAIREICHERVADKIIAEGGVQEAQLKPWDILPKKPPRRTRTTMHRVAEIARSGPLERQLNTFISPTTNNPDDFEPTQGD